MKNFPAVLLAIVCMANLLAPSSEQSLKESLTKLAATAQGLTQHFKPLLHYLMQLLQLALKSLWQGLNPHGENLDVAKALAKEVLLFVEAAQYKVTLVTQLLQQSLLKLTLASNAVANSVVAESAAPQSKK